MFLISIVTLMLIRSFFFNNTKYFRICCCNIGNAFLFIYIIFILTTHNLYEKKKIIYHPIQKLGRQQGISDNNVRHNSIQYQSRFAYFGRWLHDLAALSAQRNISFRFIWGMQCIVYSNVIISFGFHSLVRHTYMIIRKLKIRYVAI